MLQDGQEKQRHTPVKPDPWCRDPHWEESGGTSNMKLLSKRCASQPPGPALERQAPKMSGVKNQQGLCPWETQGWRHADFALRGHTYKLTHAKTQCKNNGLESTWTKCEGDLFVSLIAYAGGAEAYQDPLCGQRSCRCHSDIFPLSC